MVNRTTMNCSPVPHLNGIISRIGVQYLHKNTSIILHVACIKISVYYYRHLVMKESKIDAAGGAGR